jgi:hypothetical protein
MDIENSYAISFDQGNKLRLMKTQTSGTLEEEHGWPPCILSFFFTLNIADCTLYWLCKLHYLLSFIIPIESAVSMLRVKLLRLIRRDSNV